MRQLALLLFLLLQFSTYAQTINFNELVTSDISTLGEVDTYSFSGTSGDLIRITSACGDNPSNTAFDPEIELIFPDGSTAGPVYNNNCADINLDVSLNQSGTYQIRITDWSDNDMGNYNLYLEKINPAFEAIPIVYGDVVQGSLENNGDIDLYTFSGNSGDLIRATMACNSVISNTAFDPELQLVAPDGSIYNSDYNINCSDINYDFELPQTGTYTIIATDWNGNDFGEYNLFLEKLNSSANAKEINYGEYKTDTLELWGDIDLFNFSGSSGELIRINMACHSDIVDTAFDPEIQVMAPDGTLFNADNSNNCTDINYDIELTQSGTYTIIATDWSGNNSGKYNLHLNRLLPANNATALSFGTSINQTIARNGEFDLYTFSGSAGDLIEILMNCTSETEDTAFDPEVQVISPDGSIFSAGNSNNCSGLEYSVQLTQSGTHTVIASDWSGNNFGAYELSANYKLNPSFTSSSTTIDQGQSIEFTDNSSGSPTSWNWVFEGGTPGTSTLQNPTVTYNNAGVYDVSLTVSNGTSSESITQENYINVVSTALSANFSSSSTSAFVGDQIDFTDLSTGSPTSWNWTFEGGTPGTSTEQNPSVTYSAAGIYDVTLTISDGTEENTLAQTDFITVIESNTVLRNVATISAQSFGAADADVQGDYIYAVDDGFSADVLKVFDISNPSNPIEVFSMDFTFELEPNSIIANGDRLIIGGDGGGADASLVIMDISNPVSPTIIGSHLTIPRADGEEARSVSGLRNIKGDILYTQSGIWNLMSIDISNPSSPLIIDGFGDNFTGLIFGVIGSFIIQDDNNAWLDNDDFRHATIDANGGINMGSKMDVQGGELYDFRITSQNNIGYAATWQSDAANVVTVDFSNQQINELYTQDIDSLVGGYGFSATMELYEARNLLFVSSVVDFLALDISNRTQPIPLEVNEGSSFLKRDGDILITKGFASVIHVYLIEGGTVEELSASFSVDQTTIQAGQSVQFTDNSSGNPTSWNWTFEGGTPSASTEQNPVVLYETEGVYDVTLEVGNEITNNELLEVDLIQVTSVPQPDIAFASINLSLDSEFAGNTLNATTELTNAGDLDVVGQFSLNYYLSSDNIVDANDVDLGTASVTDLAIGETKSISSEIVIPSSTIPGNYVIIFEIDPSNEVEESNEDNNLDFRNLEVKDRIPFVSNPIQNKNLEQGFITETIDLSTVFEDPDQDQLTFTATSSDNAVATINISGSSLILVEQGSGFSTVSVTADDNEDGSVTDEFLLTINATGNSKPTVANAIEDVTLFVGFNTETIELIDVFTDEDGDNLELTIEEVDGTSVNPLLDGTLLTLAELDEGTTSITLRANDGNGGLVFESFNIDVIANQVPIVENPISNVIGNEGFISETISLENVFSDPDGDDLTYSTVSNDELIVTVSISGTNLIVVEQGIGEAVITVTADDGNGGTATDEFTFTVNDVNEAPILENPIPDISLEPGFITEIIELDTVFVDPDEDALTYTVSSSNEEVVLATISDNNIVLTETGAGSSTITVIANDGRGESVEDSFNVLNQGNTPPIVLNPVEDQILSEGFVTAALSFESVFSDPDDDELSYTVESLNEDVIVVSISGTNVVFIEQMLGTATIVLTADDGRDGIAMDTFDVDVVENNVPIVSNPIEDQILEEGFGSITYDLSEVFSDEDGDVLVYTATSSDESIVMTSTTSAVLTLTEVNLGDAIITVIAEDDKGGSANIEFSVEIIEGTLAVDENHNFVYPTLTNGIINISTDKVILHSTLIKLDGTRVMSFGNNNKLFVEGLSTGIYILKVDYQDGSKSQMRVIVR